MADFDFCRFAEALSQKNGRTFMAPVIEKELLHYEILRAMSEQGLLNDLTFQGGTCLRLCYGAERYSEDLDFAGGEHFDIADLQDLKQCVERSLSERYQIVAEVTEPTSNDNLVKKWRIRIDTSPARKDLSKQRISLEVASIPAYTRMPKMLMVNYEGIPSGYADIIVQAESPTEILADKLESFICASHVRYRDIWDMFWLKRRPDVDESIAQDMRARKASDYGEQERFAERREIVLSELPSIVEGKAFQEQLRRFLPTDLFNRSIARSEYRALMTESLKELYIPNFQ